MATNKKINECGWFYHAPAKRQNKEPVPVPVASQIPGLNYELPQEEEPQKLFFKDTDTKYVRLAKQGGRQNLLNHKENPNMREKPQVHYPRSEWFYLEDNALEDAEQQQKDEPYQFMVPEYMCHDTFKPDEGENYERPRRAPFSFDNKSAYERGQNPTDKTIRLPEVIKPGYGVRSGKPIKTLRKPMPKAERARPIPTAKDAQMDLERPRLKYLPLPESSDKDEKAKMMKLLSYTYDKEWHDNVRTWQYRQDKLRDQHRSMLAAEGPQNKDPIVSEYNVSFGKPRSQPYKPEKGRRVFDTRSAATTTRTLDTEKEKELFKMNRFKNIPSKLDTQVPKKVPVAAAN